MSLKATGPCTGQMIPPTGALTTGSLGALGRWRRCGATPSSGGGRGRGAGGRRAAPALGLLALLLERLEALELALERGAALLELGDGVLLVVALRRPAASCATSRSSAAASNASMASWLPWVAYFDSASARAWVLMSGSE